MESTVVSASEATAVVDASFPVESDKTDITQQMGDNIPIEGEVSYSYITTGGEQYHLDDGGNHVVVTQHNLVDNSYVVCTTESSVNISYVPETQSEIYTTADHSQEVQSYSDPATQEVVYEQAPQYTEEYQNQTNVAESVQEETVTDVPQEDLNVSLHMSDIEEVPAENSGVQEEMPHEVKGSEEESIENPAEADYVDNDTNDNIREPQEEPSGAWNNSEANQPEGQDIKPVQLVRASNVINPKLEQAEESDILEESQEQHVEGDHLVIIQEYETVDQDGSRIVHVQQLSGDEQIFIEDVTEEVNEETVEEMEYDQIEEVQPKQRGRRPAKDIPYHVLGRDISNPAEPVANGRSVPKPRLGVKVPYRNLTSQIVSKEDIQREIMERARQKQQSRGGQDNVFAKKLTQRLARKLGADSSVLSKHEEQSTSSNSKKDEQSNEIENNSELLAILEGDDDDVPLVSKERTLEDEAKVKMMEREIALQQLQELPNLTPKQRTFKGMNKFGQSAQEIKRELHDEVQPINVNASMIFKTYSRKRKSEDVNEFLQEVRNSKKVSPVVNPSKSSEPSPLPPNTYVTKSSRIIKKKVIWDPDEKPSKTNLKLLSPPTIKEERKPEKPAPVQEKKAVTIKKIEKKEPPTTPKKTPVVIKGKKRLTEVDKLLMDEGAVNMIYDVTNSDDVGDAKRKKSVISIDKAHKELMKKTSEIKNDLQNSKKESPKSLRKKDGPSPIISPGKPTRKLSKDSNKSSVHTPPASPAYPNQHAADASRIIRRRSSSSISSGEESDLEDRAVRKKEGNKTKKKKIVEEVVVPSKEKDKKEAQKSDDGEKKAKEELVKEPAKKVVKVAESKFSQFKSFVVKKTGKLVNLELKYSSDECFCTVEILKDLTAVFKLLTKEKDCFVVSLTSSGKAFCLGLDYKSLVSDKDDERKKKATEMSTCVKEFIKCLLNFPKVLVAGIQGDCMGLAVTMLPLFDMVVATDSATFSTPYARLGSVAEAGFLLTTPHLTNHGLAAELLYTSQKLKADDAFRRGLITRLCWPEKYQDELKNILLEVSKGSKQSLEATKTQLRQFLVDDTEAALISEAKLWVEHWMSEECQSNFANLQDILEGN